METKRQEERSEPEIVYSRSVKAGRRIYYLDVKKARNADLYICITESKKKSAEENDSPTFEKHKVFLYKEDFNHFMESLEDVVGYVKQQFGEIEDRPEWTPGQADVAATDATAEEENAVEAPDGEEKPKRRGLFGYLRK